MSTIKVANVHFDSAGTNRIDYVGGDNILRISSGAIKLPVGDTASRPTDEVGLIRYNSETGGFEGRNASAWGAIGGDTNLTPVFDKANNALANTNGITTAGSLNISGAANITSQLTLGANLNFDTTLSTKITDPGANVMTFVTAQTERLRIDANGNIGIGNTSPSHRLSVNGNSFVSGGLTVNADGGSTAISLNTVAAGSEKQILWQMSDRSVYFYGQNDSKTVGLYDTTGVNRWYTDTSGNMYINGSAVAPTHSITADTNNRFQQGIFVLRSASPTIYFRDTDHNSAMIHNNSNLLYILRGGVDTETWSAVNGEWPWYWNLSDNSSRCGGALVAVGDITAFASDERLKTDIRNIENALDKVKVINGVKYKFNDIGKKLGNFADGDFVGVLAHEVEKVLPEVVAPAPFDTDPEGNSKSGENYKTVKYDKIVPLLIEAIKELSSQVDELKKKLGE